jgi:ribonuclease Y
MEGGNAMATILIVALLLVASGAGYWYRAKKHNEALAQARNAAAKIIKHERHETQKEVNAYQKNSTEETKQYQNSIDQELEDDLQDNQRKEAWIEQRMKVLNQKKEALANRADTLAQKRQVLNQERDAVRQTLSTAKSLIADRWTELQKVADLKEAQAQKIVLDATKQEMDKSHDQFVNNAQTELESSSEREAEDLIALAMEHSNVQSVQYENHRSFIADSQEYLGKIIGNSGQNVRALEALTGVDIIIDDQEKEVIINGYDPVHRAVAMEAMEAIKTEKRVVPDTIEKLVNKANKTIDQRIRKYGEDAVRELKLKHVAPDLIKIIGRMHYRTSYGQNILEHSIETAKLAGIFAVELGEDPVMARRAGLLHDIGKSIDRDIEATHVELGIELTTQFRESPVVVNTIASHHGDVESKYVIADLVEASDAISGARQGARSESAADYLQRIKSLEGIANHHPEVQESYAIQAGRELRVIVQPKNTNDKSIHSLATNVKNQIEEDVTYPGQVKVTVVRKLEIVEYAERKQA